MGLDYAEVTSLSDKKSIFSFKLLLIFFFNYILSYYSAVVFQWITSCNKKCYDHTCINMFAGICNVIDDVSVTTM